MLGFRQRERAPLGGALGSRLRLVESHGVGQHRHQHLLVVEPICAIGLSGGDFHLK